MGLKCLGFVCGTLGCCDAHDSLRWEALTGDLVDARLMGTMAHEQAHSEVPRPERMRAYAFLGCSPLMGDL